MASSTFTIAGNTGGVLSQALASLGATGDIDSVLITAENERKTIHLGVKRLHIELDNGPEIASSRTQFMKRLVEFVDRHRVAVELV